MQQQTNILQYRFSLASSEAEPFVYDTEIKPLYKKDLAITYEQESEQQFFRNKLSSKITIIGSDYEKVMALPFSATRHIKMDISFDNGRTYTDAYKFKFVITDCEIDEDKKTIEVQPSPDDLYEDAINGYEKEFDIVKDLKPEIKPVRIAKRGMLQVYLLGEPTITCFFNGLTWNQDVDEQIWGAGEIMRNYYFGQVFKRQYRLTFDVEDVGSFWALSFEDRPTEDDKLYLNGSLASGSYITCQKRPNGLIDVTMYDFLGEPTLVATLHTDREAFQQPFKLGPYTTTYSAPESQVEIYARWIQDKETFNSIDCYPVPKDDFVGYNRNYKWCLPFDSTSNESINMLVLSRASASDPTGFAQLADGRYAVKPESAAADFYPLYEGYWGDYSMWLRYDLSYELVDEASRKWYTMSMGYPVYSVINELLKKIAPEITHLNTPEYSEVLYGEPLSTPGMYELILTPKTNITVSDFSEPAMKGAISLKDILDMFAKVYRIYWFIEDNKLKLERLDWFKNGGSYDANSPRDIGIDLTKRLELFNNKPWSFYTSSYSFNKDQIPGQFKFSWMDEVTVYFEGYPIDIDTPLAAKDNIEEVQITKFTTDIDYMLLNTEEISKDGFALLAAYQELSGDLSTMFFIINRPIMTQTRKILQNGQLSFVHLLGQVTPRTIDQHGWLDDMPAQNIVVKDNVFTATSTRRIKTQDIVAPLNRDVLRLNAFNLIRTKLGNGIIDKISVELSSGIASITLLYDTPI